MLVKKDANLEDNTKLLFVIKRKGTIVSGNPGGRKVP